MLTISDSMPKKEHATAAYVSPEKRQALQMSSLNLCISFISGAKIVNIVESTIIYQLIKYCTAILFRGYYL